MAIALNDDETLRRLILKSIGGPDSAPDGYAGGVDPRGELAIRADQQIREVQAAAEHAAQIAATQTEPDHADQALNAGQAPAQPRPLPMSNRADLKNSITASLLKGTNR